MSLINKIISQFASESALQHSKAVHRPDGKNAAEPKHPTFHNNLHHPLTTATNIAYIQRLYDEEEKEQ